MKRIERLLRDTIGLDAGSIGSSLIERTVRLRMKAHGLTTIEQYQRLVETSDTEWDQLMESVVRLRTVASMVDITASEPPKSAFLPMMASHAETPSASCGSGGCSSCGSHR